MIEVGNIVTLDNNEEYLLLEILDKGDTKYVYSIKTLPDESLTDQSMIFEVVVKDDGEYLKPLTDNRELYDQLIEEFQDVVADKLEEFSEEDIEAALQEENAEGNQTV